MPSLRIYAVFRINSVTNIAQSGKFTTFDKNLCRLCGNTTNTHQKFTIFSVYGKTVKLQRLISHFSKVRVQEDDCFPNTQNSSRKALFHDEKEKSSSPSTTASDLAWKLPRLVKKKADKRRRGEERFESNLHYGIEQPRGKFYGFPFFRAIHAFVRGHENLTYVYLANAVWKKGEKDICLSSSY